MNSWDDKSDPNAEITDLETARLALRGALQSARNLQDINAEIKGQLQDFLHREKALNERMILLQKELNECYRRLDDQAALGSERDAAEREALRKEIAAEQNQKLQAEMNALAQSVENWAEIRREKETELAHLKAALLQKEAEVFTLQKEKISQEEKAHRDMLDVMAKSRTSIYDAVEAAVKPKEGEISSLKIKVDTQEKETSERLENMAAEVRQQEQEMLEEFRKRQQALELEHTRRERELWEHTQQLRASLEEQLKAAWDERQKTVEHDYNARRSVLESDWRQKEKELNERWLLREAELHRQWTDKETAISRDWMSREKNLLEEFQQKLDQERERGSNEISDIKSKSEAWRVSLEQELHRKEMEFNRRHQDAQEGLRATWRRREEELLAKHQEISEKAQVALAAIQSRYVEKDAAFQTVQEKIVIAQKERDVLTARLHQVQRDAAGRQASLEEQVRTREEELKAQSAQFTAIDEDRSGRLSTYQRDIAKRDSEVQILQTRVAQIEVDRDAAIAQAVALQADFDERHQSLEVSARAEINQLRTQLTTLAQGSTEREQDYQRRLVECETLLVQRDSQLKGMDEQLTLARNAVQDLTDRITAQDADYTHRNTALQERLVRRETELVDEIQKLRGDRDQREETLRRQLIELQNDLATRLQESKVLEVHFLKTQERREDAETRLEALQGQIEVLRREFAETVGRLNAEASLAHEQSALVRAALERRTLELESEIRRLGEEAVQLQDRLNQQAKDRDTDSQTATRREGRLQEKSDFLEHTLQEQDVQWNARLTAVEREHLTTEAGMQHRLLDLEAEMARRAQYTEQLAQRLTTMQTDGATLQQKHDELQQMVVDQERQAEATRLSLLAQLDDQAKAHDAARDTLTQHVRSLESDLRDRETWIATLRDEHLQSRKQLEVLAEACAWTEKGSLEKVQFFERRLVLEQKEYQDLLSAARQQNIQTSEASQRRIQELETHLQRTDSELVLAQESLAQIRKENSTLLSESTIRDTAQQERIQSLEERLRNQKEQMTAKVASVDRERLLNEEALHTKMLDLEQRLVQKTGTSKMLQDRLTRIEEERSTLEKKVTTLESHVVRVDQQLKNKETEYVTAVANAQKEQTTTTEGHQRKVLELQNMRQALEAQLAGLRESLASATTDRQRLDARVHELQAAMATAQTEALKQQDAQQSRILKVESDLTARVSQVKGLQEQISMKDGEKAELVSAAQADKEKLSAENLRLEKAFKTQEADFEARWTTMLADRTASELAQSDRIRQLQDNIREKESSLQSLTDQLRQLDDVRQRLEARGVQDTEEATRQRHELEVRWQKEQERVRALTAQLVTHAAQIKALDAALATSRAESAALTQSLEKQRETAALEIGQLQTTEKERQDALLLQLKGLDTDLRAQLKRESEEAAQKIDALQHHSRALSKEVAERGRAIQDLQARSISLSDERDRLLARQAESDQERARLEALDLEHQSVQEKLNAQLLDLQNHLTARENELKALGQRIDQKDAERQTADEASSKRAADWNAQREVLQERLLLERDRAYQLEQALAGKISELKELQVAWTAAQQDQTNLTQARAEDQKQQDDLKKTLAGLQKEMSDRDRYIGRLRHDIKRHEEEQTAMQSQLDAQTRIHQTQADTFSSERVAWSQEKELLHDALRSQKAEFDKRLHGFGVERAKAEEVLHLRLVDLQDQLSRRETELKSIQLHDVAELQAALETARLERETLLQTLAKDQQNAAETLNAHEVKSAEALAVVHARMKEMEKELRDRLAAAGIEAASRLAVLQKRILDLERQVGDREESISTLEESLTSAVQARDRFQQLLASLEQEGDIASTEWAKERDTFAQRVSALEESLMAQRQEWEIRVQELRETHRVSEAELVHRQSVLQVDLDRRVATLHGLEEALKRSDAQHAASVASSDEAARQWSNERAVLEGQLSDERLRLGELQSAFSIQASQVAEMNDRLVAADEDRQRLKSALSGQQEKYLAQVKRFEDTAVAHEAQWQQAMDSLEAEWRARVDAGNVESQERAEVLQTRSGELERQLGLRDATLRRLEDEIKALQEQDRRQSAVLSSREAVLKDISTQRDQLAARVTDMEQRFAAQRAEWDGQMEALRDERRTAEHGLLERQSILETDLKQKMDMVRSLGDALARAQAAHDLLKQTSSESADLWTEERAALDASLTEERARLGELQSALSLQATDMKGLRDMLAVSDQDRQRLKGVLSAQQEKYLAKLAGLEEKNAHRETELKAALEKLDAQWRTRMDQWETEAKQRAASLQQRSGELEQALGSRDTQLHQLQDQVAALQEQTHRQDDLLSSREAALQDTAAQRDQVAARLQTMEQGFTAQRNEWERKLTALRDEHRTTQEALQERHDTLRTDLDRRMLELQTTEETLRQAEAAHQASAESSDSSKASWAKERQALEAQLTSERLKLRDLQGTSSVQASQIKELQGLMAAADGDRQRLKAALGEQQEKYLAQVARYEESTFRRESDWKVTLDQLENEWRGRVEAITSESKSRAETLLARAAELESQLGAVDTERRRLDDSVHALQEAEHRQQSVHLAREQSLQETAAQRDRLAERIQSMEEAFSAQRADWEDKLSAVRDEHHAAEQELKKRQSALKTDLEQKEHALRALEQALERAEATHATYKTSTDAELADWAKERNALEDQLRQERVRLSDLQGELALQTTAVKELQDVLAASDSDRRRLQASFAVQQEKYVAQAAKSDEKAQEREANWKAMVENLDVEWRRRIEVVTADSQSRVDALQARSGELEQSLGQRDTEMHRLEDQVNALQEQDRRQEAVLASREAALKDAAAQRDQLAARLQSMDAEFASQRAEWDRKSLSLREEQRAAYEALQARHDSLKNDLEHRVAELQATEEALRQAEKAHQELSEISGTSENQWAKERQAFEKALTAERVRLRDLQGVSTLQSSQIQELKGLMGAADQDRQRLKAALAEQQEKYLAQVSRLEETSFQRESHWKKTLEGLEGEWTGRVEAMTAESAKRVDALQTRSAELETQLGTVDVERRRLDDQVHALQEHDHRREAMLTAREAALHDMTAERDGLTARLETMELGFASQRAEWEKKNTLLRDEQRVEYEALQARHDTLQDDLQHRVAELQATEEALRQAEKAHQELVDISGTSENQWAKERQAFEKALTAERVRLHDLQGVSALQSSQIQELRGLMTAADQDRQRLKAALSEQQDKYLAHVSRFEETSFQRENDWKKTLEELESEWIARVDLITAESKKRVESLQARSTDLETQLGALDGERRRLDDQVHALQEQDRRQETMLAAREAALHDTAAERDSLAARLQAMDQGFAAQRADWDRKLSTIRDEHRVAYETLQERHDTLSAELDQRMSELHASEEALRDAKAEYDAFAAASGTSETQWSQERQALEKNLTTERVRLRDLQGVSTLQASQIQELKGLMAAADQDRQRLKAALSEQQEKYLAQVSRIEENAFTREVDWKTTLETLETEWRNRVEAITAESKKRVEALQTRSAELETQLGTVDAERRRLEDSVHALQEADRRQEAIDSAREKTLQDVSAERDQLVEQLRVLEQGFADQRAAWDEAQVLAQDTQRASEQGFQKRLAVLQHDLTVKSTDLQALEHALAQAKTASSTVEWSAKEAAAKWEQERAAFDARIMQERQALARAQSDLDNQLAQMKELQQTLSVATLERDRLKKTLTAQQDKFLARVAQDEATATQQAAEAKKALDALDVEWRQRMDTVAANARQQTDRFEKQTQNLEKEVEQRLSDLQSLQDALAASEADRSHLERVAAERQVVIAKQQETETQLVRQLETLTHKTQALEDDIHLKTRAAADLEKRLADDEKIRTRLQAALAQQSTEAIQLRADFEQRIAADRQALQDLERRQADHLSDMHALRREVASLNEERTALMDRMADQAQHFQSEIAKRDGEMIAHETAFRVQAEAAEKDAQERMARWISESDQRVSALQARRQDVERMLGEKEIELRTLRDRFEKVDEERQRLTALDVARERTLQDLKTREREWLRQQDALDSRLQELEALAGSQAELVTDLKTKLDDSDQRRTDSETLFATAEQARQALEHQLTLAQRQVNDLQRSTSAFEQERKQLVEQLADQRTVLLREGVERHAVLETGERQWHERLAALDQEWRERAERASRESVERISALQKRLIELEHDLDARTLSGHALTEQLNAINAETARLKAQLAEREHILEQAKKSERQAIKRSEETQRRLASLETERAAQDQLLQELRAQLESLERSTQASDQSAAAERERLEKELLRYAETERSLQERLDRVSQDLTRRSSESQRLEEQLSSLKSSREELEKSATQHMTRAQARQEFEERWLKEKRRAHELQEQFAAQGVKLKDLQESLALATQKWKADQETHELQKSKFAEQMEQLRHHASEQHSTFTRTIQDLEEQLSTIQKAKLETEHGLEKRCATLQDQLAQQIARVQTLETQLSDSERDRQVWDKTLSEGQSSLDQERRHWQTRLTEERQRASQMERELSILRAKLVDVQQHATQADTERQTLQDTLQTLKDRQTLTDRQASEQIEALQQRSSELELQSAEHQGEVQARQQQIAELQSELKRMEALLSDKKGNLAKHRQALEAEFKMRVQTVERQSKEQDAMRRREWERREREMRESHTSELEKAQASFLSQVQALRDESEQTLSRLQSEGQASAHDAARSEHHDLQQQLESARMQLDQQKKDLAEQRRTLDERTQNLSQREKEIHEARAGADELRDKMVSAIQTGSGRSANASVMQSLLEEWVFGFAHQVRNPMGIIRSIAETLLMSARSKSPERNSLQAILKAVDGLNHRLAEFIEFSKPVRPVVKSILLPQSWDRVTAALKERLERQQVTIETKWPDPLPLLLLDPEHLHTMLIHLMVNALDVTPAGGTIKLSAQYDKRSHLLQIRIVDQGSGIRREHLKEVGKPFFTTKTAAVGLGLALTKRLLRAYDGELVIEPATPHGTSATLKLYAQEGEATAWAA